MNENLIKKYINTLDSILEASKIGQENNNLNLNSLTDALEFLTDKIKNKKDCNFGDSVVGYFIRESIKEKNVSSHK